MRRGDPVSRAIAMMIMLVSTCCLIAVILSTLDLPEITSEIQPQPQDNNNSNWEIEEVHHEGERIGKFGEMMLEMLPHDVAFTVFVPSDRAFEHILGLRLNHSYTPEEWDNTYATVSRVLGFSAIPQRIHADSVPLGEEISIDSVSGLALHIFKDLDGAFVVNRVRAEMVDIRKGERVVHIMDGVLMDAEFQNVVLPHEHEEHRRNEIQLLLSSKLVFLTSSINLRL